MVICAHQLFIIIMSHSNGKDETFILRLQLRIKKLVLQVDCCINQLFNVLEFTEANCNRVWNFETYHCHLHQKYCLATPFLAVSNGVSSVTLNMDTNILLGHLWVIWISSKEFSVYFLSFWSSPTYLRL